MSTIKYYLQNFGISKKERKIEDRILLAKYSNRDNIKFLDLLQFYKKLSYNRELKLIFTENGMFLRDISKDKDGYFEIFLSKNDFWKYEYNQDKSKQIEITIDSYNFFKENKLNNRNTTGYTIYIYNEKSGKIKEENNSKAYEFDSINIINYYKEIPFDTEFIIDTEDIKDIYNFDPYNCQFYINNTNEVKDFCLKWQNHRYESKWAIPIKEEKKNQISNKDIIISNLNCYFQFMKFDNLSKTSITLNYNKEIKMKTKFGNNSYYGFIAYTEYVLEILSFLQLIFKLLDPKSVWSQYLYDEIYLSVRKDALQFLKYFFKFIFYVFRIK